MGWMEVAGGLGEYVPIVGASLCGFAVAYLLAGWLSGGCEAYRRLDGLNQHLWSMRIVSAMHGLLCGLGGVVALTDPQIWGDAVESWSGFGANVVAMFVGYTLYDLLLTLMRYGQRGGPWDVVLHHVMVLALAAMPLTLRKYALVTCCYLANELSTPFLHVMHFLKYLHVPKSSALVKANQLAFAGTFFVCRVLLNSYAIHRLVTSPNFAPLPWLEQAAGLGLSVCFLALNMWWFVLIVRMAVGIVKAE